MIRYRLLILPTLCLMAFVQSCVHGGLSECPPMVNYAVAFKYTSHTGTGDRFYDDVKKIDLFVFDEDNLIYTTTTQLSPYETNFNIPLDIPVGNYHIIAWGNVLEDGKFTYLQDFVKGVTTLGEARLALQREADNLSRAELEKLFYGEKDIMIPLYVDRIDTIPLINDTNRLRVVIHWDHTGALAETEDAVNYDEVQVSLKGSNAKYGFHNNFVETDNVVYQPYSSYDDDDILTTDPRPDELNVFYHSSAFREVSNTCVYDFSLLRMMINSPLTLSVERKKLVVLEPYDLASIDIISSFNHYFDEEGFGSNRQELFDRYENYRIDFYFSYDKLAGTYVTGGINVLDWKRIEQPSVPGSK
jgi:hypothetical protein